VTSHRISKNLGTFGKLATYSFYPAHHMSTGEGGFIATDDYEVYKTLVSFRDWGRDCICRGKSDAMK
jgi:CDP-4-dehydro-6-deoxyglucose reductase, E1